MSGHPDLTSLSNEEIRVQCRNTKQWLLDYGFATEGAAIAYPYESTNERVADITREYFAVGFGGPYRYGTAIDDPLLIGRVNGDNVEATLEAINVAATNGRVLAIMYHFVGTDDRISVSAFWETLTHIRSKGEDLRVITPSTLARLLAGEGIAAPSAGQTANASVTEGATTTESPIETPSSVETTTSTESPSTTATGPLPSARDVPTDSPSTATTTESPTEMETPSPTSDPSTPATTTGSSGTNVDRTTADGPGFSVFAALSGLTGWAAYRLTRSTDE